jgi:mannitol/fructose-specific phosphotransferase system IIA component (Ntr-type)
MRLEPLTRPELIFPALSGADGEAVLCSLAEGVAAAGAVPDAGELFQKLVERERLGSTAVGGGVAIPHCKLRGLGRAVVAVGRVEPGIDFGAPDGLPVRAFFLVASPVDTPAEHLQMLSRVSRWIKTGQNVERLLSLRDRESIQELLAGGVG